MSGPESHKPKDEQINDSQERLADWAGETGDETITKQDQHRTQSSSAIDDWEWAVVEIFGHRRHAGRIREIEQFGAKMLRIDIPIDGDATKEWTTHFYGGSSIFSLTLSDEASVMRANKPYAPASRLTYRKPADASDIDNDHSI